MNINDIMSNADHINSITHDHKEQLSQIADQLRGASPEVADTAGNVDVPSGVLDKICRMQSATENTLATSTSLLEEIESLLGLAAGKIAAC